MYKSLMFTDTNSVICKIIVGGCRLPLSLRASAHTGVGIRFPAMQSIAPPLAAGGDADCHVAALLAMTWFFGSAELSVKEKDIL